MHMDPRRRGDDDARLICSVDVTSQVKFEDAVPRAGSMPSNMKGQGRGEPRNRDG
jgi:hypothetical protein